MYSPLKHWKAVDGGQKMTIGIAGIGGLGTMGIKLAAALGHRVVAISSSDKKRELATEKGAEGYVVSTDPESIMAEAGKLDLILNTICNHHSLDPFYALLATHGTLVNIGCIAAPMSYNQMAIIFRRLSISGSVVGGISDTKEVLRFCAEKGVLPDVKVVTADKLDEVFTELQQNNATGIRYVLDIEASLDKGL